MKKTFLLCLLLSVAMSARGAEQSNPGRGAPPSAGLDEYSRLVQELAAERAKLIEARQPFKKAAKQAKTEKNERALQAAQEAMLRLEREFAERTATLKQQIKAKEAAKNVRPARPGTAG
jgi:hypothetical protein